MAHPYLAGLEQLSFQQKMQGCNMRVHCHQILLATLISVVLKKPVPLNEHALHKSHKSPPGKKHRISAF